MESYGVSGLGQLVVDTLKEFLSMGGYAFYVWTSYAIVAALLVVNLWIPLARGRRLRRRLRLLHQDPVAPDARK